MCRWKPSTIRALLDRARSGAIGWERIPDLGRTLFGVTATPVTAPSQVPGASTPHLEYRMFLFDSGAITVKTYLSPTLDFSGSKEGRRYAVSFDDQPPKIINVQADTSTRAWEKLVADNIALSPSVHTLAQAGEHVLKFWLVDPGVVLQKIVIETRDSAPSYLGPPESFFRGGTFAGAATSGARKSGVRR